MLLFYGFSVADLHDLTYGRALNIVSEYNRFKNGDDSDDEECYSILSANREIFAKMHDNGQITDEMYNKYLESLKSWEVE